MKKRTAKQTRWSSSTWATSGAAAGLCLLLGQAAHGRGELVVTGAGGTGGAGGALVGAGGTGGSGGDPARLVVADGAGGAGGTEIGGTGKTMTAALLGGTGDARFGEPEEGPYFDLTPICNYLERGLDDQAPGQRDGYVLQPVGITTLSDINRIAFGLDLPATHCSDNPRTLPCTADADPKSWCIQRVELEVMGLKLVDLSGPTKGCLMTAHGGEKEAGITTLDSMTLRHLPTWGLTDTELNKLLGSLRRGADGKPAFLPSQLVLPGEFLARTLEGQVGQALTRDAIGCSNPLYCGHRPSEPPETGRFKVPTIRLANAQEANCDLGNCPPTSARKSSPWVEVAGAMVHGKPTLQFDVDFAVERDRLLWDECSSLDGSVFDSVCAVEKAMVAHGSLEVPMAVACSPFAHVAIPQGDPTPAGRADIDGAYVGAVAVDLHRRLPYCGEGIAGKCFQPGVNAYHGTVVCAPGDADPICGAAADFERATFDQHMEVGAAVVDLEGGLAVELGEALCAVVGCDLDALANTVFGNQLNSFGAAADLPLFTDLAGCPATQVAADGTLTLNFSQLDACYPGSPVPDCFGLVAGGNGGGGGAGGGGFVRDGAADDFAGVVEDDAPALPSSWTVGASAAGGAAIGDLVAGPAKHTMGELNGALEKVCALASACDPELDIQRLPLRALATLSAAAVQNAAASGDLAAAWDLLGFLADSRAFREDCLAWGVPAYNGVKPVSDLEKAFFLSHMQTWVADRLDPATVECAAQALNVETMLPTFGLTLRVTTGGGAVRDRFAFVNFKSNLAVTDGERAAAGCGFRHGEGLPAPDAPRCGPDGTIVDGPEEAIGQLCGTMAGGPCADFTADYYYNDFADFGGVGNDPAHVNKHPNGTSAWNHLCFPDETSGRPMVCVSDFYPGAGLNTWPTCKVCGLPADGEDADRFTMEGCPPVGAECPEGLALGSDGKCWDATQGRPDWECAADCSSLYGDTGYCQHAGPWLDYMSEHVAAIGAVAADVGTPAYAEPICVDWACPDSGIRCGWQGLACFNGDVCVEECAQNSDCQANDSAPAYPNGFICSPEHTCIPG